MNAELCLQKLKLCGVLSFATVDKNGGAADPLHQRYSL